MSTERSTPEKPTLPEVAGKPVDNVANARAFKDEWTKQSNRGQSVRVSLPGTRKSVEMNHVEVKDNVISVWTSTDPSLAPDFVLVNAPTEVMNEHGIMVEDPMTAIALAIDGATK